MTFRQIEVFLAIAPAHRHRQAAELDLDLIQRQAGLRAVGTRARSRVLVPRFPQR